MVYSCRSPLAPGGQFLLNGVIASVIIVGAGINGLASAWRLAAAGARVTVIGKFSVRNDHGGSHGASRIYRTAYADPLYVDLMRTALNEDWPRLELDLLFPKGGCFFGTPGPKVESYLKAMKTIGPQIFEPLSTSEARKRFGFLSFDESHLVFHDHSAGVVAAESTCRALERLARHSGATFLEHTSVETVHDVSEGVCVATTSGVLLGDKAVLAAGARLGSLCPELAVTVRPVRQSVLYYPEVPGSDRVWAWLGEDGFYGLPDFGRGRLKVARHRLDGTDPPDSPSPRLFDAADVQAFVRTHFAIDPGPPLAQETCLYAVAPNEDFQLGPLSPDSNILVASACSGHAFKFAPLTGRLVMEWVLEQTSSELAKKLFAKFALRGPESALNPTLFDPTD
ncbi:MAG: FAD-dependent oxidoreductase [Deltaproteobacteria bacterium]|nr:FAD-dependent oxidoreductase [Deltaproteobacteria bacterium]